MVDQVSDVKCSRPKDFHSSMSQRGWVGGRAQSCETSPEKEWKKNRRLLVYCWSLHSVSWDIGRVKWHLAIRWQIPMLTGQWAELRSSWLFWVLSYFRKWTYRSKDRFIILKSLGYFSISLCEDKRKGGKIKRKQINFQVWGYTGSWEQAF